MKKLALSILLSILVVFPSSVLADPPTVNIPPTNAYSSVTTQNGSVSAPNFIGNLHFVGQGHISVTSSNGSQTVYFNGAPITPVGDRFGWFASDTSGSGGVKDQHFYNFSTGKGISATIGPDDFILSAVNFVNASSKSCGANSFFSSFSNATGIFVCTPATATFNCDTAHNCVNLNTTQTIWQKKIFNNETQIGFTQIFESGAGTLDITTNTTDPNPYTTLRLIPRAGTFNPSSAIQLTGSNDFGNLLTILVSNSTTEPGIIKFVNDHPFTIAATDNSLACFFAPGGYCTKMTLSSNSHIVDFFSSELQHIAKPTDSNSSARADSLQLHSLVKGNCADNQVIKYKSSNGTWICGTVVNGTGSALQTTQNVGKGTGSSGVLAAPTATIAKGKNITTTAPITNTNNATDITLACPTCLTAAITSINSQTGPAYTLQGTTGNITMTNSTNHGQINLGSQAVITNGANQTLTKQLNMSAEAKINGLFLGRTVEKTGSYTPTPTNDLIIMNVTSGSATVNLPTAKGTMTGKVYNIRMDGLSSGNVVTVKPATGETIEGFSDGYNMTHADQILSLQSNGTAWMLLDSISTSDNILQIRGSTTRWTSNLVSTATTGSTLDAASTLYATPLIIPATEKFDKMGIEVSTVANPASTLCRVGIYQDNGNVYPSKLISGSDAGESTTTAKMHVYNFTTPITLKAGLYWTAVSCATAATTQPTFRASNAGLPAVLGFTSTGGVSNYGGMYRVNPVTYGAMPTTFPAGASVIVTNTLTPILEFLEMTGG